MSLRSETKWGWVSVCLSFCFSFAALAGPVAPLPESSDLDLEIKYFKSGKIYGRVVNNGSQQADFDPRGLFFVPVGQPNVQRMAVAGKMAIKHRNQSGYKYTQSSPIEAGESADVVLSVYCIDKPKRYPTIRTPLRLANQRLPEHVTKGFWGSGGTMQTNVWRSVKQTNLQGTSWHTVVPYTWKKKKKGKIKPSLYPNP